MGRLTHNTIIALALGVGLTLALVWTLNAHPRPVLADPGDLFVTTDGSGTACTQDTPCSLQTALEQAVDGDTIYVAQGTYTGTGSAVATITQSITLRGGWDGTPTGGVMRDPDVYPTTLHGEGQRRGVFISGTITTTLDGFIITGGNATGLGVIPYNQYAGGGICSVNASPIIINNVITHNLASSSTTAYGRGGGIHLANASATSLISGNLVISNTASTGDYGLGGGISTYESNATIRGNRVMSNTGSTSDLCWGGGMLIKGGQPYVAGNTIQGNIASVVSSGGRGGGLALDMTSAHVVGNLISANKSAGTGAGCGGGVFTHIAAPTFDGNRIISNTASSGGGICIHRNPALTLTNNVVAQNAEQGLYFYDQTSNPVIGVVVNNTFAQNMSEGIYINPLTTLTLTNNIIISHTIGIYAAAGTTTTVASTLFFGNTVGDMGGLGTITSTNEITGSDPLFIDAAGWDYHILPGSPAIDAGTTVPWLTTDIDGDPRPWPAGGAYDIGADELQYSAIYLPLVLRDD
jgi:hypothetical protein